MFDSIINEAQEKFNLGDKAGSLLASLLGLIANPENGGFGGFIERFKNAGLGTLADSWITTGDNTPISNEQLESALGEDTISAVADQTGIDKAATASALSFMTPHVVDALTPDGEIPDEAGLLSRITGFLSDHGGVIGAAVLGGLGVAGPFASGAADEVGDAAGAALDDGKSFVGTDAEVIGDAAGATVDADEKVVGAVDDTVGAAMNKVDDTLDDDGGGSGGILKWLIPLLLLGLLIVLGYWFLTGKSTPIATTPSINRNVNKANTNVSNTAKMVDSSFTLTAKDGKYIISGIVPDQKTLDEIKAKLTAELGEGIDFSGLKIDANAKPFAAGWWDNFGKLLPSLKGWKDGTLSFAGNAITEAVGLPSAALGQIKSLFAGWTLPASISGATTETDRKLTEVSLPDGTKLQAYPGGIEDQLITFIQSDEYKNGTAETLKEKWFSFDDLNFKFGTTELVPESKRQLDNIVAILKAFPNVKIKIGGYTDKKGDDAANKKLSDDRAKAVKSALEKSGVGAQVPEAEGYGEEFAKVPETAGDKEREADRKTSVRLLK
ncbi:MAG TPA: YidB family protein [Pyrinomonadaceae bacterium]|nr:YidB family protein [Pyrinomonadaceae bacterium]